MRLIGKIACAVGLHKRSFWDRWTPSIHARIVTHYEAKTSCTRCGKVLYHIHERWDGTEMVDISKRKECEHGRGLTDYCQPCGRTHGGG